MSWTDIAPRTVPSTKPTQFQTLTVVAVVLRWSPKTGQ